MTGSNSTWTVDQEDSVMSVDQQEPGISDVHSGAAQHVERRHRLQQLVSVVRGCSCGSPGLDPDSRGFRFARDSRLAPITSCAAFEHFLPKALTSNHAG